MTFLAINNIVEEYSRDAEMKVHRSQIASKTNSGQPFQFMLAFKIEVSGGENLLLKFDLAV